ncbi:MAG: hypothetical protein J7K88_10855 [Candidatus Fermentibacteraceae bacterium]|nr:hypothetical protein [Candidatus Fermentibacteraceae bacterium]
MPDSKLVLSIPQGITTATSLGIEGLARHYSPGSGKHFTGRKLFVELAVKDGQPDFAYLDDGGWRDAETDSVTALAAADAGNRTKTALSNNAFSCTPIQAYRNIFLVKTAGHVMAMENAGLLHTFKTENCHEGMSLSEVVEATGYPDNSPGRSHLYLVMCPIQLLLLSNLSPVEYAWYATHRPGKVFRQVIFTELKSVQSRLAAESRFVDAQQEINTNPEKKTKTIVSGDCINEVPFRAWCGYDDNTEGGLYVGDQTHINQWRFPDKIPVDWDRASC